jgi:hypothetical protein
MALPQSAPADDRAIEIRLPNGAMALMQNSVTAATHVWYD